MSHSIRISMGRNVGSVPMSGKQWFLFSRSALAILESETAGLLSPGSEIETHRGEGIWAGVREESTILSAYVDRVPSLEVLQQRLGGLAVAYGQDAIALSVSDTIFCS